MIFTRSFWVRILPVFRRLNKSRNTINDNPSDGLFSLRRVSSKCDMTIYKDIITIEAGKRSGKPCIRGMRITVEDILRQIASGMTFDDIVEDFPELTHVDIRTALEFAAEQQQHIAYAA